MPQAALFFQCFPLSHIVPLNPSLLLHATYIPYYRPYTTNTTQSSMNPAGFEPPIPARERQQTHALDGAGTAVDTNGIIQNLKYTISGRINGEL
jgi:hypothetical protein